MTNRNLKTRGTRLCDQHKDLIAAVEDPETCLIYRPAVRHYYLPVLYGCLTDNVRPWGPDNVLLSATADQIDYCPWSGHLLPGPLDHARARVAAREFSFHVPFPELDSSTIYSYPRELIEGEDWWIKRKIDIRRRPEFNKRNWDKPGKRPNVDPHVFYRDKFGKEPPPGEWRPPDDQVSTHFCYGMYKMHSDVRCTMVYIPWTREHGIRRLPVDRMMETQPIRMRKIDFCPFCGTKLPSSLKTEWQSRIAEAGYDPNDEDLPEDFLSDRWWKNAEL